MPQLTVSSALLLLAAALAPTAFAASKSKAEKLTEESKVRCHTEIKNRGFGDIQVIYPDFVASKVGYNYNGQFVNKTVRYEFTCVLNKNFGIAEIVVNPIPR